jgi:hypothetical protein
MLNSLDPQTRAKIELSVDYVSRLVGYPTPESVVTDDQLLRILNCRIALLAARQGLIPKVA